MHTGKCLLYRRITISSISFFLQDIKLSPRIVKNNPKARQMMFSILQLTLCNSVFSNDDTSPFVSDTTVIATGTLTFNPML